MMRSRSARARNSSVTASRRVGRVVAEGGGMRVCEMPTLRCQ